MLKWLSLSAVVVALDLYSKHLVTKAFEYAEHLPVTTFFDLVRYHNEGAAFSFLAGAGGWQRVFFSVIALIASVIIIRLMKLHPQKSLFCVGLALILGGALGNLYDRLTLGYVVDFLFFHYQEYYWPAFNVADSAICVGVALLILDSFRNKT
ncbi:signal peptidase II Aspartic peptidase. MEROPS family A08 [Methylobacillus rhizosphaerae]|uniref:Lipoprotein signal peptidase n=1 Tax=Methylobacillus rhizosphaerae TaxID=551994 RepID=A0A238Y1D4_9PROT|nr:signal peptidase II [Methylobacillus rhizosphaerae]SNR64790.1 signal peptidase II Aspartic peptidase. MEROPS family A08 [Methylobacillus rhizosphaerae]